MIDLFKRISEASKNAEEFSYDSSDTSLRGHEAEHEVCNILAPRLIGTGWELTNGVRVPDPTARRRRELDFVLTSPTEAIVVELKNWTGDVTLDESGGVIQVNRKGELVNHGRLFEDLAERAEILRLHHLSKARAPVRMRHLVVFYDPYGNLRLNDEIVARADVLRFDELRNVMPNGPEPFLLRLLHALMRFFGFKVETEKHPLPSVDIVAFRQSLAELGGWDVIRLHGGLTLCGDILSISGKRPDQLEDSSFDRATLDSVEFDVDRSIVRSIFQTPSPFASATGKGRDASIKTWNVPTAAELKFHRAGDKAPTDYEIRNMESIQFGYQVRPKTAYRYEDFHVGMTVVGRVTSINDKGLFIDIGYRESAGRPRAARARLPKPGTLALGQRVLARITRLLDDRKLVSIEILEPRLA
ncbi:Nuclease-related domain [Achromobacter spanius]|uniref:NERD domain-containing protein n=1 Tax=Achromobacter spanius TaxID=217203 RepID=UPI000D8B98C6|nr:NERD domain-containing protein [Achromobacter spanius]CAB3706585.1 hypothetical protein LMG5911_05287 [Achromobacter spanius]SPT40495.1 Nuclease-related domain [Achromobacter denitrificans]VEE58748.1 Nuclease-related domain [Achromobacter spanius]